MKCCIDVISLILYQFSGSDAVAVLALQCYHSLYRSLKGCLIVKCFCFLYFPLQRGVKDVFFKNSKLKYTGVPLHICTDVNREMGGNDKRGIMDAKG